MTTIRGTKNLMHGNRHPEDDIEPMLTRCHVIGWQEVETLRHRRALRALGKRHGFRTWMTSPAAAMAVAISWRPDVYALVDTMTPQLLHPRPPDNLEHAGPARYVSAVILRHRETGRTEAHANTHLIHQAWSSHPERREIWKHAADKLERITARHRRRWDAVIGGGDVNRSWWFPATADKGHWDHLNRPTIGGAHYDVIWTAGTDTGAARLVYGGNSDHHGLLLPIHQGAGR